MHKSTNAGASWTQQTIVSGTTYGYLRALAVDPADTDRVFALGSFNSANRLYYTENGGSTWQERSMSGLLGTPYDIVIHPADGSLMAAATSTGLFATSDGGATWSRVTTAFSGAWCVTVQEGTNDLLVGTNSNGAWIWEGWSGAPQVLGSGMPDIRVNTLLDVSSHSMLYAGTFGNSMWINDYGSSVEQEGEAVQNPLGFSIHPNPVQSGHATANFTLPDGGMATIQVFDLTGRVVMEHTSSPGESQALMDVSPLPPGAYIGRLASGSQSATVRLVVIR